jgi:peptide-methionine (S)-S-oxide reductase
MKQVYYITIIFLAVCTLAWSSASATSDKEDAMTATKSIDYAVFGAGCFWCVESEFQAIKGVIDVVSGYAGGHTKNPTYEDVSYKDTGHIEVVRVSFDPKQVDYNTLIEAFWHIHDPTQVGGQGVDMGSQYISAILPLNNEQMQIAEAAKVAADASGAFKKPIATIIKPAGTFYEAEAYHQNYYAKKGIVYKSVFDLGGESTTMKKRKQWLKQIFGN